MSFTIDYNYWLNKDKLKCEDLLRLSFEESPDDPDLNLFSEMGLENTDYEIRRDAVESWIRDDELEGVRKNNNGSIEYENINP